MSGSFSIGKIAGTRVAVHISWLLVLALLLISLANAWFPPLVPHLPTLAAWTISCLGALLLFASILAHELTHTLLAHRRGVSVESITIFPFGGISDLEHEPKSAGVEYQIALVGPVTNLFVGGCSALAAFIAGASAPLLTALLNFLALSNLLIALFNVIPGLPLDGGRLLRSVIWKRTGNSDQATYWAALAGQIAAYVLILVGIWLLFGDYLLIGIWLGFIGWFMLQADTLAQSQDQLDALFRKTPVSKVMCPIPLSVPPYLSLQELVDVYLLPHGLRAVVVVEDEQLLGLITLHSLHHIAREQWNHTQVEQAMLPCSQLHMISPEQNLSEALTIMVTYDINQLPVVYNGHVLGIISRENILHLLETRQASARPHIQLQSLAQPPKGTIENAASQHLGELVGPAHSQGSTTKQPE